VIGPFRIEPKFEPEEDWRARDRRWGDPVWLDVREPASNGGGIPAEGTRSIFIAPGRDGEWARPRG
jgi:hypothetical protein